MSKNVNFCKVETVNKGLKVVKKSQKLRQCKVCPIENNTNLNLFFCLIKISKIDFIFLPAFYLIMWLITSPKNFEKK